MSDMSFIGKGKVYLGPYGGAGAMRRWAIARSSP